MSVYMDIVDALAEVRQSAISSGAVTEFQASLLRYVADDLSGEEEEEG